MPRIPAKNFRLADATLAQIQALRERWAASSNTQVIAQAVKRAFDQEVPAKARKQETRS